MKKHVERVVPEEVSQVLFGRHIARYALASRFVKDKKVLDLACGTGYGASYLLNSGGARTVTGVDISEEAIDYARKHYQDDGLLFLQGDATGLEFEDNSFDVIVSLETLEHIPEWRDLLSEIKRTLKKEGILIISTPNRRYASRNSYHFRVFSLSEFDTVLENMFEQVNIYGQCYLSPLGKIGAKVSKILSKFLPWRAKEALRDLFSGIRNKLKRLFLDKTREPLSCVDNHGIPIMDTDYEYLASSQMVDNEQSSCRYLIGVCKK